MKPIRILHMIGNLNVGGSQTMIMNIYRNIDRSKIQFDFIVDRNESNYFESEILSMGGKVYALPTFKGWNVLEIQHAWKQFFLKHPEYMILHSHVRSYASIYLPIAKKYGLKTIIHSHSTSSGSGINSIVKNVMQFPIRYIADYFMACSEEAGKWLFGKSVISSKQFMILKNSIDAEKFVYSDNDRNRVRDMFELKGKYVIGHIGRFTESKNHDFLINIFKALHDKKPDSVLLLVGDGELKKTISEKVEHLDLQKDVFFTGKRSDIPALLSAMDVFVFPSLYEGLGIVAVEAQAAGLHTICADTVPKEAQLTELLEYISLSDHPEKWADHILQYADGYERKNMYSAICKTGYDIHESVIWLEDFYLRIMN